VARKGEEILETLIARKLIEQALRAKKLEVTAAEIDQEIDNVAMRVAGIGREAWLRTLDKERGISPVQYARDIIYPALALRKLAAPAVVITDKDKQQSFEAMYGEKLRCRMIMVDKVQAAKEIWEALRKNPAGFEKMAMERSMDSGSRSLGGLLAEPISRHAYPQNVSDAAFAQLVDGDVNDKDPTHKPKDGDFTGPIQVAEATWVILRREGVIPGQKVDGKDERVKKSTYDMIYEVKLKEAMGDFMVKLMEAASIDNKLTGRAKEANEQLDYDKAVQLSGNKAAVPAGNNAAANTRPAPGASTPPQAKLPTPVALPPEVAKQADSLTQPRN
jgi:foldase protein PrsA